MLSEKTSKEIQGFSKKKQEKNDYCKRKRAPKQSEDQKKRAKSRLSKLCRGVFKATGAIIIMDDRAVARSENFGGLVVLWWA